jgi:hypothetical protein
MGQVCIFNSVGSTGRFAINGGTTPPVKSTSMSQNFVPQSIGVDFKKRINVGVFGYGSNEFLVSFNDSDPKFDEKIKYFYDIELSRREISLLDDVVIYVFRQLVALIINHKTEIVFPRGLS